MADTLVYDLLEKVAKQLVKLERRIEILECAEYVGLSTSASTVVDHNHWKLVPLDGAPDPAFSVNDGGYASFPSGASINEFSNDGTMVGNSDLAVPTEKAVVTYVETMMAALPTSVACATGDIHAPAANTAAVVTYGATASIKHIVGGVAWSYNADPTGGNLQITDNGNVIFNLDIATKGVGFVQFIPPKRNAAVNSALVVTLAAGGAACTGKVNVTSHWTE